MSLPFPQHEGHTQPTERKEPMPLSEVLSGSVFVSATGRVYRLFGNEDEACTLPSIPPIPALSIPPLPILFDPALMKPESTALPVPEKISTLPDNHVHIDIPHGSILLPSSPKKQESHSSVDSSIIQIVHAMRESATPKFLLQEGMPTQTTISIREITSEIVSPPQGKKLQCKKNQNKKDSKPFHDIPQNDTENFIIPFVQPAHQPSTAKRETETKNFTLKIVQENIALETTAPKIKPSVLTIPVKYLHILEQFLQRCQQRNRLALWKRYCARNKERFGSLFLSVVETFIEELPTQETRKNHRSPLILDMNILDTQTACWSDQIDSLIQSASNQIQTLTDHLAVQFHQGIKTICFKSIFPCDGCSTILLCAVKAMLDRHFRILLIDAHHQHIDLPHRFHLHDYHSNYILAIQESLGLWAVQKSKTEEENRAALTEIIAAGKEKYDMILIDGGSLTESPLQDLVLFWNQVRLDGIVLVSDAKRSADIPLSHITGRLRQNHIHIVGIAENYV